MKSRCAAICGHVVCRSRVSTSDGNHARTTSAQSAAKLTRPRGANPASTAGATYLRTVLRSTPRLSRSDSATGPHASAPNLGHIHHVERSPRQSWLPSPRWMRATLDLQGPHQPRHAPLLTRNYVNADTAITASGQLSGDSTLVTPVESRGRCVAGTATRRDLVHSRVVISPRRWQQMRRGRILSPVRSRRRGGCRSLSRRSGATPRGGNGCLNPW